MVLFKHFIIFLTIFIILISGIFSALYFDQDEYKTPYDFIYNEFVSGDVKSLTIFIYSLLLSFLFAYVLYLLLTTKSRVGYLVEKKTGEMTGTLAQFIKIYEEAPVPYITLDKNGVIKQANKAAIRFFGVIFEEIDNKNILNFLYEEDLPLGEKFLQYYKLHIPTNNEEVRMVTKKGEVRWVLLSIFEIRNLGSLDHSGLVTIFDITEQKKLDQAKTEFVSLASHQLRSPLATMKWYTEMILSEGIGPVLPKQKDYLKIIYNVNIEMISLVNTLLNISRVEIGSLPIEKSQIDAKEIMESVLTELALQSEKKKINFERHYDSLLENTVSDPKLLRIVIHNLVSNAIKYTPEGGKVDVIFNEAGGDKRIIIKDNGCGIPKDEQAKIFSKQFRATNVQNIKNSQSTGLGLYLVKSIMEKLEGNISFTSEENQGSVFTITI